MSSVSNDRGLFNDTAKKNGAPLVKIHSKPMGVVTPSPKTNFAPKQISTPKPEQSKQIPTIKQIATDESFELRKSASPQKLSVVVQPPPPPPPPPPPSPTPPPPKTPSFPAKPGFTPRSVLKSNKPKPNLPPLSSLAVKKEISLEDGTMRETDFSLSAIIGPKLPSSKNPRVALVQPQPHITQKPVARVPPSPQLRNVSDEESPHKTKVVKNIVEKHDIKSGIHSEDASEPQTSSGDNTQAGGTHSSEWNVSNSIPTTFGPALPPDTSKNVTPIKKGLGERKEKVKVVFKQSTKKPHKQRITETESDDAFENPKDPKVAYSEVRSSEKRKHRKRHHQSSLSSDDHHFKRKKRRQRSPSPDYSDKEEAYKSKRLFSEDNYPKKKHEGRHRKHKHRRYTYDTSSEEESEHEFRRKRDEGRSHGSERSRPRQYSPESRFSKYRSPSVERHRRRPGKG